MGTGGREGGGWWEPMFSLYFAPLGLRGLCSTFAHFWRVKLQMVWFFFSLTFSRFIFYFVVGVCGFCAENFLMINYGRSLLFLFFGGLEPDRLFPR